MPRRLKGWSTDLSIHVPVLYMILFTNKLWNELLLYLSDSIYILLPASPPTLRMVNPAVTLLASLALASIVKADAWADKYGGFPDPAFAGVATFAHLDHQRCLDNPDLPLDLAIIGIPYDSAVTFRPGMSPRALESGVF